MLHRLALPSEDFDAVAAGRRRFVVLANTAAAAGDTVRITLETDVDRILVVTVTDVAVGGRAAGLMPMPPWVTIASVSPFYP